MDETQMGSELQLALFVLLILATAYFVASEFAIVKLRPSRIDQLVLERRRGAMDVKRVTSNLDAYLSACQLGITITALGLGWLGEPTFKKILHPLFEALHFNPELTSVLSFLIAFLTVTYLHVVLGELAPKTFAIYKAEQIALLFCRPLILFYKVAYPFIWLLNGSANRLVRLFGLKPAKEHEEAHSEEEIRIILTESYESGKINKTEFGYVNRIFAFDELLAREIMVPRTDMVCLYMDNSFEENMRIIKEEQYTRFPVVSGDKDHVIGTINTKQFFLHSGDPDFDVRKLIHPPLIVPETMPVKRLLQRMQQENTHIAILVDEYGGTAGMITIEDILEEIVGEIRDEFDADEDKEIEKVDDNRYIVDGKVLLSELNDLLQLDLESEGVDTIGGWMFTHFPEPQIGMSREYGGYTFAITEMENHRIRQVEITRNPNQPAT
jgi:CBS domain containing-hemolysin-like protein